MTDDRLIADLLDDPPASSSPAAFRIDVFARIAVRARRRAALWRAAKVAGAFGVLGLVFPLVRAIGVTDADMRPVLLIVGAIGLAYLLALLTNEGPRRVLARPQRFLRVSL